MSVPAVQIPDGELAIEPDAPLPMAAAEQASNEELLARLHDPTSSPPGRGGERDEVICRHIGLVRALASRFRHRGESYEDLVQVGMIGLIKSVDRYDPTRETSFRAYAIPNILGEIKRHFRDKGWALRVPRPVQELRRDVQETINTLSQRDGHAPTVTELAHHLDRQPDEIIEALEANNAYHTHSLDVPLDDGDGNATVMDTFGNEDTRYELIDNALAIHPRLRHLPDREREILWLRFFEHMTQSHIAERMGISQMHVSRLISQTLTRLRTEALPDEAGD